MTVKVTMANTAGSTTFTHWLAPADIEAALATNGYNYTISINTANADSAGVTFMDPNAVDDATGSATGWVKPDVPDCNVNVHDFCLDSATDKGDGTWAFNFTIKAASNQQCGSVSATMDIIYNEDTYLGEVVIPDNEIISSFECDCTKTFTVTADFDGSPGDVYGQLDIRNAAHSIIEMIDSGVLTIGA